MLWWELCWWSYNNLFSHLTQLYLFNLNRPRTDRRQVWMEFLTQKSPAMFVGLLEEPNCRVVTIWWRFVIHLPDSLEIFSWPWTWTMFVFIINPLKNIFDIALFISTKACLFSINIHWVCDKQTFSPCARLEEFFSVAFFYFASSLHTLYKRAQF